MFQLELVDTASGARRSVPLLGESLLIGNAVDCDLVLPSPNVAAHHCRITRTDHGFRLAHVAGDPRFETLLNGGAVAIAELSPGEVLRIGPYQLVVVAAATVAAAAPPVAPPTTRSDSLVAHDTRVATEPPSIEPAPALAAAEPARAPPRIARPSPALRRTSGAPAVWAALAVAVVAVGAFLLLRDAPDEPRTPPAIATAPPRSSLDREEVMRGFQRVRPPAPESGGTAGPTKAPAPSAIEPAAPTTDRDAPTSSEFPDPTDRIPPVKGATPRGVPAREPGASSAVALQAQAREKLDAGEFAEAQQLLELALDSGAPAELKAAIARDHERATRPLELGRRIAELLAARPLSGAYELRLRDGRAGRLVRSDGERLRLKIDGVETDVAPSELFAASLLELSGHLPLTADEALDRAFVALACGDDRAFFAGVDKAAGEAAAGTALRASIDSALAFQRGLERVPTRGFLRSGDRWLTWEEKAEEDLRREIRGAIAASLAPKADGAKTHAQMLELAGAAPALVVAELSEERSRLAKSFVDAPEQKKLAKLRERLLELKDARKHALELIFDEKKYFYPYTPPECPPDQAALYPEVQREVDLRVDALRTIWGPEAGEPPDPHVALSAALVENVRQLKLIRQMLHEVGRPRDGEDASLQPAWCLPENTRTVHLRNFALDEYERGRLDQDAKVMLLNGGVVPADGGPTREEIEQVLVTNRYRAMLGRRVLAYNSKLWTAARSHSEWMSRVGRLSHFEDDPERASPDQRMKLAGYDRGAGENCAAGRMGPLEVLQRWCHSSGHHRNLLYESHTELGSGQSGNYWTQCFGGGREYKGNLIHD